MKKVYLLAASAAVFAASAVQAADIDVIVGQGVYKLPVAGPSGPIYAYDAVAERRLGASAFVSKAKPRNGNGSLEISGDRTRYVVGNLYGSDAFTGAASQSLFKFSDLTSLTFDWQVANPSLGGGAHNTPAVRVHIIDNGVRSEMIWEGVYNGGVSGQAPATGWQNADASSLFYLNVRTNPSTFTAQNPGFGVLGSGVVTFNGGQVNRTIGDWQSLFSADAIVTGLSFGSGGGAGTGFRAFVDNVGVRSPNGNNFVLNFEAVPEPATWAMMIGGFGFVGAAARRRSTKIVFA